MCRYITFADYFWLAEQVTGIDALTISKASRIELADSALNTPRASFAGTYFYPDPKIFKLKHSVMSLFFIYKKSIADTSYVMVIVVRRLLTLNTK